MITFLLPQTPREVIYNPRHAKAQAIKTIAEKSNPAPEQTARTFSLLWETEVTRGEREKRGGINLSVRRVCART